MIQVIGVGAQDDYDYAVDFVSDTGVHTPDMLWDPSFETWTSFGVRANSQMRLMTPDLASGSDLFFGFDQARQDEILAALPDLQ